MICNVLIEAGIDDVGNVYSSDMVEKHVEPHCDDSNRETVPNVEDRVILERVANRDSSNDETSVGENHSPPTQMEVYRPRVNDLHDCKHISCGCVWW